MNKSSNILLWVAIGAVLYFASKKSTEPVATIAEGEPDPNAPALRSGDLAEPIKVSMPLAGEDFQAVTPSKQFEYSIPIYEHGGYGGATPGFCREGITLDRVDY